MAWAEDDECETSRWLSASLAASLPLAQQQAMAALVSASPADMSALLGPTLSLVAPSGMSEDDQTAWLVAARDTLDGIPADLLDRGCRSARRKVDHPSKIIPAIFAEVGSEWDRRKADLSRLATLERIARDRPAPPAGDPMVRPDEAAAIIDEFGLRGEAVAPVARHEGPPREPTIAELAQIAKEIGIGTTACSDTPVADITGLTITQINEQAHRLKAEQLAREMGRPYDPPPRPAEPPSVADEIEDYERFFG